MRRLADKKISYPVQKIRMMRIHTGAKETNSTLYYSRSLKALKESENKIYL